MNYHEKIVIDENYMKICFDLAKQGAGGVSPNPLVGALVVKNNRIISSGWHKKCGQAHAEVNAINSAKETLESGTLYCNLEPCVHTEKQTPPCVPQIITSGIKKVVVANIDPNPKVRGRGISKLIENGIEVQTGILQQEGEELNRFFFSFIKTGLPFVTLKIASSSDGKIARSGKEQTWLTGKEARKYVHEQRAVYDAVLIGANTVNVDDPELTVREVEGRNPFRIILDGNLGSNINAKIFNDKKSRTVIICSTKAADARKELFVKRGMEVINIEPAIGNIVDVNSVLVKLGELKITSLLVEGGGAIFSQFIKQKLVDELLLVTSPVVLGSGIDMTSLDNSGLVIGKKEKLGDDLLTIFNKDEVTCSQE